MFNSRKIKNLEDKIKDLEYAIACLIDDNKIPVYYENKNHLYYHCFLHKTKIDLKDVIEKILSHLNLKLEYKEGTLDSVEIVTTKKRKGE